MIDPSAVLTAKLLIVDDQQSSVLLLERILRGGGYESVASTRDPREVCELHRRIHYDLILLDLQMPGMDGFQLLDKLREVETEDHLSVLVMTAHPGHKQRALQAGARDFVSKPLNAVEVLTRVYAMLEMRFSDIEKKRRRSTVSPGRGRADNAEPPQLRGR